MLTLYHYTDARTDPTQHTNSARIALAMQVLTQTASQVNESDFLSLTRHYKHFSSHKNIYEQITYANKTTVFVTSYVSNK
jgi:hypothetical protein